jgi:hypothetical protein
MPLRDPNLQHQVVIDRSGMGQDITVSCNCRKRAGVAPMAIVHLFADTVRYYNNSEFHVEPFGEEWKLNGQRSQGIQQGTTQASTD